MRNFNQILSLKNVNLQQNITSTVNTDTLIATHLQLLLVLVALRLQLIAFVVLGLHSQGPMQSFARALASALDACVGCHTDTSQTGI